MKIKGFILIVFLLSMGLISIGCTPVETPEETEPTISVAASSVNLEVEETATIEVTIGETTEDLEVLYASNDENIATVNGNVITAIAEGTTKIVVSLKDYPEIKVEVTVTVEALEPVEPLTLTGDDQVLAGQTITLIATDVETTDNVVFWESSDTTILTVSQTGVVTGVGGGDAFVKITSLQTGDTLQKAITVIVPEPVSIEMGDLGYDRITLSTVFRLSATVLPVGSVQDVIWTSSDESIATIDDTGRVTPLQPGEVTMKAKVNNTEITGEITFNVEPTAMELLASFHNEDPIIKNIQVFGWEVNGTWNYDMYSSVNDFLNEDLEVTESLISLTRDNRPGTIKESTQYITIHDTASGASGGTAAMHDAYVRTSAPSSWHYSLGNDGIFHHVPDNEVAYHAGDGSRTYTLTDSGVKATTNSKPTATISTDGYYELNGTKTSILAPKNGAVTLTTAHINDNGIETVIGENGNWWMGSTWYSSGYNKIGNYGGNRNSIGIESMVNNGSDVYYTWQKLAKLVAVLLEDNNLGIDDVVQHHYFSGKDCPMTMRHAGMWDKFLKLVESEYIAKTYLSDYTIKFVSNSPYIDNRGRIIDLPTVATRASYNVQITDINGDVEQRLFYVNLPAKQV